MIEAKDLRLGNWVETYIVMLSGSWYDKEDNKHGNDVLTEPAIRLKQVDVEDLKIIASSKLATYRPIPLTEELLVKCGFELKDMMFENVPMRYWRKNFFIWHPDVNEIYLYNEKETQIEVSVKYLHQLQNIYYCLTGEELEIKL